MLGSFLLCAATTCADGQWHNDPLPEFSVDYAEGSLWWYDRPPSRVSPFDLDIEVQNSLGQSISSRPEVAEYLTRLFDQLWNWNATEWASALDDLGPNTTIDAASTMSWKANAFWEATAQLAAERIFGPLTWQHEPVQLLGPSCVAADGEALPSCLDAGLIDAAVLNVTTRIDGARDPLMPVTRTISLLARRAANESQLDISVSYVVVVPAGLPVGSPHRELLEFRPRIGDGDERVAAPVRILATSPGTAYPDYNRLFVPLRHLLLQGHVEHPKLPETGMRYTNVEELREAFAELLEDMRGPAASLVATRMKPFLCEKYYYMFDEYASGVDDFKDYILSAVESGWKSFYDSVRLSVPAGVDGSSILI
jgi:hypothetical protein